MPKNYLLAAAWKACIKSASAVREIVSEHEYIRVYRAHMSEKEFRIPTTNAELDAFFLSIQYRERGIYSTKPVTYVRDRSGLVDCVIFLYPKSIGSPADIEVVAATVSYNGGVVRATSTSLEEWIAEERSAIGVIEIAGRIGRRPEFKNLSQAARTPNGPTG